MLPVLGENAQSSIRTLLPELIYRVDNELQRWLRYRR